MRTIKHALKRETEMPYKKPVNNDGLKTVVIQSKVSPATAKRLDVIAKKYDFQSRYEILQYLISAFLHYADPKGERVSHSDESSVIGNIFRGFDRRTTRVNSMREREEDVEVSDTIEITHEKGCDVCSCKWTHHGADGDVETSSVSAAFQVLMSRLLPDRHEYLMGIASDLDSISALRALDYLIEADKRCGVPASEDWASNVYGDIPVRKAHKTMK